MYLLVVKLLFNGSCCIGTSTVLVFYYFPIILIMSKKLAKKSFHPIRKTQFKLEAFIASNSQ